MKNLVLAILLATASTLLGQKFNLGFEQKNHSEKLADGWIRWGDQSLEVSDKEVYAGKYAAQISASPDGGSFGCIAYRIPANYRGSSITLTGMMKISEVADGFAGLLLRVDGAQGPLAFDNMQKDDITGSHDWQKYQVTVAYPEDAQSIFVGGILVGKGRAWFDELKVTIDGKNLQTLPEREAKIYAADLDSALQDGSGVEFTELSERAMENLCLLGRVWGFMKYHHPSIAAGVLNWDNELFRFLPEINSNSFHDNLLKWIQSFPIAVDTATSVGASSDVWPDWVFDEEITPPSVAEYLRSMALIDGPEQHYYVSMAPNIGNPTFKNERSYKAMKWQDDGLRILALLRYWNMIEYFFPYKHLMDEDWAEVLIQFIPKILEAEDELSYKLCLLSLIGKVQDTHANIWMRDSMLEQFHGVNMIRAEVNFVEDLPVIMYVDSTLRDQIQIGDVIKSIDGLPIEEAIEERIKYCPASNRPTQLRDVARRLLRTNSDSLHLVLEGPTTTKEITLTTTACDRRFFRRNATSHRVLEGDIGYIYPGTLRRGEIDTIMADFIRKKGLIIDLRCYPSDFIVFSLGKYLMPEPTPFVKFTRGDWKKPGQFTFSDPIKVGKSNPDYFRGQVIILNNEMTQSQAEYTTMALRVAPKATVVGSTTAGADGNISPIILPGGIRTMISGIGVYYPDGKETQRVGIIPDIELKPTIDGIRAGKDELLEKAMQLILEDQR